LVSKNTAPFFRYNIRKPNTLTDTLTITSLTLTNQFGGNGGRFMDILYDPITGETPPGGTPQIQITSSTFTTNIVDGDGGIFYL
jgi:hypothetical protein